MQGVYSIAEIINSCWQAQLYGTKVNHVIFCVMGYWDEKQLNSFRATLSLCQNIAPERFAGAIINNVSEIIEILIDVGLISLKY